MDYQLWILFTVWLVSSTIASKQWVEIPTIGHRPKGADEKRVSPSVSILKAPLSATKAPVSPAKTPFRPSKSPLNITSVPPRATALPPRRTATKPPPTSTLPPPRKLDSLEDQDLPEPRIEPGLPVDEFMKAHKTLSHYGKGSVVEKVNFLDHLKKQLLQKTAELMPRAIIAFGGRGRSPATRSEGRGHKGVGFPSSEGTLMSLCFLVFAVFLVKIVMQLIQGLQNNALGVVTGAATRTARSYWDRVHTEEELLRLLESLQVPVPEDSTRYHIQEG